MSHTTLITTPIITTPIITTPRRTTGGYGTFSSNLAYSQVERKSAPKLAAGSMVAEYFQMLAIRAKKKTLDPLYANAVSGRHGELHRNFNKRKKVLAEKVTKVTRAVAEKVTKVTRAVAEKVTRAYQKVSLFFRLLGNEIKDTRCYKKLKKLVNHPKMQAIGRVGKKALAAVGRVGKKALAAVGNFFKAILTFFRSLRPVFIRIGNTPKMQAIGRVGKKALAAVGRVGKIALSAVKPRKNRKERVVSTDPIDSHVYDTDALEKAEQNKLAELAETFMKEAGSMEGRDSINIVNDIEKFFKCSKEKAAAIYTIIGNLNYAETKT